MNFKLSVIRGFHRDADEICVLLGYHAASNDNPLPTFRDSGSILNLVSHTEIFREYDAVEVIWA
jgi:hypothetical protein